MKNILLLGLMVWCSSSALEIDTHIVFSSMDSLFIQASSGEPRYAEMRKTAREEMVAMNEKAVDYLVPNLNTRDAREHHGIKDMLKEIGKTHGRVYLSEKLCSHFSDTSGFMRRRAVFNLAEAGTLTVSVGEALKEFKPANWKEQAEWCRTAGKLGMASVQPKLIKMLKHEKGLVRKSAVAALGSLKDPEAIPIFFCTMETDTLYIVRFEAARMLAGFGKKIRKDFKKSLKRSGNTVLHGWLLSKAGEEKWVKKLIRLLPDDAVAVYRMRIQAFSRP